MQSESISLDILARRIEGLERQNHRLRQSGGLLLLAFAAVFLMGQTKAAKVSPVSVAKVQEAGKFILKDGRGKKKAELGLFLDRPALVIYDEAESAVLSLGAEPEGAGLTLYDKASGKVAGLSTTESGPVLTLYSRGEKRLNISVTSQGPAVGLVGRKGEAKAALGLTAQDDPFLHLFGAGERGGVQLVAAPDRTALRFFDSADRARAVLGILEKESAPGLVLNDDTGAARAILMLTGDGPGIDFFDRARNRTWSAR